MPALLPTEGGRLEMITVRGILSKVEFSSEEIDKHKIKQGEGGITWNQDFDIEVNFNDTEWQMIQSGIRKIDEEKRITIDMLATVEKLYRGECNLSQ